MNLEAPNVAIVGRPNVGKSALFNRLVGRQVAIVHNQPGVTRDRIAALSAGGSRPFTVWDTAGLANVAESEVNAKVREAVQKAIRDSNVLLFVVDAQQGLHPLDQEVARLLRKSRKPILLVVNKIDEPKHEDLASDFGRLGFGTSAAVSAAHGRGIAELISAIDQVLPAAQPAGNERRDVNDCRPLAIAIVGRPNVGKSSFINAIAQRERAIVSELPGTTRDAIDILYQRGTDEFIFIDTAGIRRRGKQSSSAEVFSVMRAERSIRRAALCVLMVDLTIGLTAQDKRIAGLIQQAQKGAIIVLNKWDLVKPRSSRGGKQSMITLIEETRRRAFFLDYAPIVIASARTGENVDQLFAVIRNIQLGAAKRIGTGMFNRLLRAAWAENPPPMIGGRRLKLFYAAQASGGGKDGKIFPPEFVLFVNDPRLVTSPYRRYLEARIRKTYPYPGLPLLLTLRPRTGKP